MSSEIQAVHPDQNGLANSGYITPERHTDPYRCQDYLSQRDYPNSCGSYGVNAHEYSSQGNMTVSQYEDEFQPHAGGGQPQPHQLYPGGRHPLEHGGIPPHPPEGVENIAPHDPFLAHHPGLEHIPPEHRMLWLQRENPTFDGIPPIHFQHHFQEQFGFQGQYPGHFLGPQIVIGPNGKPKRRRVATLAQRRAANIRERRRMFNLNEAFDNLRKKVPTFAYEKRLSRIETLRLAITYISFMADLIEGKDPKDIKLAGANRSSPFEASEEKNSDSAEEGEKEGEREEEQEEEEGTPEEKNKHSDVESDVNHMEEKQDKNDDEKEF